MNKLFSKSKPKVKIKYKTSVNKHTFGYDEEYSVTANIECEEYNVYVFKIIYHSINFKSKIEKINSLKGLVSNIDNLIISIVKEEISNMQENDELEELLNMLNNKEFEIVTNELTNKI